MGAPTISPGVYSAVTSAEKIEEYAVEPIDLQPTL